MKTAKIPFDEFVAYIQELVDNNPQEFEGRSWTAYDQPYLAEVLGVSVATLRRYIAQPPVVRKYVNNNQVLLRIGTPDPPTHREIGNAMARLYRRRTGRKPSKSDVGCLIGLAELWPEGEQEKIFDTILKNWPQFMGMADAYLTENSIKTGKPFKKHFFEWPVISFVRYAWEVGPEFYLDKFQKAGAIPPASLKAYFAEIYTKTKK